MRLTNLKTKMKAIFFIIISTIIYLTLFNLPGTSGQASVSNVRTKIKIVYIYENICQSCNDEGEFIEQYNELVSKEKEGIDVEIIMYNKYIESGLTKAEEYYSKYEVPDDKQFAPAVFIGNRYLVGYDEIQKSLRDSFVAAKKELLTEPSLTIQEDKQVNITPGDRQEHTLNKSQKGNGYSETEGLVVYFYVTACSECLEVSEYFDSIDGKLSNIRKYNIGEPEGLELAKEYFRVYNVTEDKQSVPIVFIDDTYLLGTDAIRGGLSEQIEKGGRFSTPDLSNKLLNNNNQESIGAGDLLGYKFIGIVAAGLVNGLNPCSISMLLFFLSTLVAKNASVLKMGLAFIAGKLITYFFLGTVLYSLLIRFDIPWFQTAAKLITLAFALIIAAINISDFIAVRHENYNKVRLQLPVSLRKYNHQWIKKIGVVKNGKFMMTICFGLGALITAGEFLCTGQIYLATIIYVLQNSSALNLQAAVYFLVYGLTFVAPLLLLTILIHKGREVFELSEFFRAKMHAIKLVNTIVFIIFGIIVLVWF